MEKNFIFSKVNNHSLKKWTQIYIYIYKDEIQLSENKNKNNIISYHISNILSLMFKNSINEDYDDEKERKQLKLIIQIYKLDEPIILKSEKTNKAIMEFRRILNSKKIEYYINLCTNIYTFEIMKVFNIKEFEINMRNYITEESFNEINKKFTQEKDKIEEKIEIIKSKYNNINKYININNEFTLPNLFNLQFKKVIINFNLDSIKKIGEYYYKLINLLSKIEIKQVKINHKLTEYPFSKKIININKEKNNEWVNIINNSEKEDTKILDLKKKNEYLKNNLLILLNKNSSIREKLKQKLNKLNLKIHLCYKCNNILQKTEKLNSNCNFDSKCQKKSFFYCKKCKIHFCTYCIVYQKYLKCGNNHTLYSSILLNQGYQCLICSSFKIPFHICSHCVEEFCFDCSSIAKEKELNCVFCSNILLWRKNIFIKCNKCNQFKSCFWYCLSCDYNFCLSCYRIFNRKCGNFHKLNYSNLEYLRSTFSYINNVAYFNKYEMRFLGRCNKCEILLTNGIFFSCIRCSLFLCNKCGKFEDDDN